MRTKNLKNKRKITSTLLYRIMIAMLAALLLQSVFFVCAISIGGVTKKLDQSALTLFNERTSFRKNYLENEVVNKWMNLGTTYNSVKSGVETAVNEYISDKPEVSKQDAYNALIASDINISVNAINRLTESLLYALRLGNFTGIFVMFGDKSETNKYGLYLHDDNPKLNFSNNSDVFLEISPVDYDNRLKLSGSSYHNAKFEYKNETEESKGFFNNPITAFQNNSTLAYSDAGWWSNPFILNNKSYRVLTYTVPLVNSEGVVYGVMGIDLAENYLKSLLPFSELNKENKGVYVLSKRENGNISAESAISSGFSDTDFLIGGKNNFTYTQNEIPNLFELNFNSGITADKILSSYKIKIYNAESPFANTVWEINSYIDSSVLYAESDNMTKLFGIIILSSTLIGALIVIAMAYFTSKPIMKLTKKISEKSNSNVLKIDKVNILEIDDLTNAIEQLHERVKESEIKLTQIVGLVGMNFSAFEYDTQTKYLYTTENFGEIIGLGVAEYDFDSFNSVREHLMQDSIMSKTERAVTYHYIDCYGKERWIEVNYAQSSTEERRFGVVRNATDEYLEKQKLLHERNYDILTNIYNRRAFYDNIEQLFAEVPLCNAAFIMFDIDNLKYINDTYGHDYGDKYIRLAADTLVISTENILSKVIGRRSGDEFYVFLYGYDSEDLLKADIKQIESRFQNAYLELPDLSKLKLRISAGISLYPDDGTDYETLIRFADYAMYEVKNTAKGEFRYFDAVSYSKNSYLLKNNEDLNRLIENGLVDYHYQPIVEISTGKIFGYEALMRSRIESFQGPYEILNVAKAQFKLNLIEKLTFFKTLQLFSDNRSSFENEKLFINSVTNQVLSSTDWESIKEKYGALLPRIVIEFTEHEKSTKTVTEKKLKELRDAGCQIALDDYGTGYNGESALLDYKPDYVKIDISLIRGIENDADRKVMVSNIIAYAKEKNIKCIAEGVESESELEVIAKMGCDYVQGYLIARPYAAPRAISVQSNQILQKMAKYYKK